MGLAGGSGWVGQADDMPSSPATPGRRRRPPRADYSRSRRVAAGLSVGAAVAITGTMVAVEGLPATTRGGSASADRASTSVTSRSDEERGSATPLGDDDGGEGEGETSSSVRHYRAVLGSDGLLHLVPSDSSSGTAGSFSLGGSGSGSVSPNTTSRGS